MMRFFVLVFCLSTLVSCRKNDHSINKFVDAIQLRIAEHQDRRYSDSLYQYFKSDNADYRLNAVLAFASIQDTLALERLSEVLTHDKDIEVRKAAAFSLGQIQSKRSAPLLEKALFQEKDSTVQIEILEALGKQTPDLNYLNSMNDNAEGVAWSLYRAGLHGITDSTVLRKAIDLLNAENSVSTRLGVANFFARGAKNFEKFEQDLIRYTTREPEPDIRMALVFSLRKIPTDSVLNTLQHVAVHDSDYRVRVMAVRALQTFPFEKTRPTLIKTHADENSNVGIISSEVLKIVLTQSNWMEIAALARDSKNGRIRANLFEAALRAGNSKELAEEIIRDYKNTTDPYDKAALLTALKPSVMTFGFVEEQLFSADTPVVRSAAVEVLVAMNYHEKFDASLKPRFLEIYQRAMGMDDLVVIGTISGALGDSTLGYKPMIKDFSFLYRAKEKLSLPQDNEALQPLQATIAYFEGKKNPSPVKNEFNHPIDWDLVKTIPKEQKVRIKTTKGDIVIQLLVEEAPGSVANFIQLTNQKYFNQKFFHRVVPNFVIQGGCHRGDGWGGEDYSIRSEFSPRKYKTGSVGMASAGKDTEGTQWFITHSPTPHLDGRYTIFAEVAEGMETVNRIEVGDKIIAVELISPAQ